MRVDAQEVLRNFSYSTDSILKFSSGNDKIVKYYLKQSFKTAKRFLKKIFQNYQSDKMIKEA